MAPVFPLGLPVIPTPKSKTPSPCDCTVSLPILPAASTDTARSPRTPPSYQSDTPAPPLVQQYRSIIEFLSLHAGNPPSRCCLRTQRHPGDYVLPSGVDDGGCLIFASTFLARLEPTPPFPNHRPPQPWPPNITLSAGRPPRLPSLLPLSLSQHLPFSNPSHPESRGITLPRLPRFDLRKPRLSRG